MLKYLADQDAAISHKKSITQPWVIAKKRIWENLEKIWTLIDLTALSLAPNNGKISFSRMFEFQIVLSLFI